MPSWPQMPDIQNAEHLAIKSDNVSRFNSVAGAEKELRPPNGDLVKSAWAVGENAPKLADVLAQRALPSVELQAFSLFVLTSFPKPRSKVQGICLRRATVADIVTDDPGEHVVAGLEETHRSVNTGSDERLKEAAKRVVEAGVERWMFTREMLVGVFEALLECNGIKPDYLDRARAVFVRESGDA